MAGEMLIFGEILFEVIITLSSELINISKKLCQLIKTWILF